MEQREGVSDLLGILVIAYEEGLQLGKVLDVYVNKQTKQIEGVSFKARRTGIEKESFVYFQDINKLGQDVVIIASKAVAKPLPEEVRGRGLKDLKGFNVATEDGTVLGEIIDLNVDTNFRFGR